MKAIVLVGGEGTRLRPLTQTVPKPLIPLIDRPFLDHLLAHLVRHHVEEVLLSSPHLGRAFAEFIHRRGGDRPRITWVSEEEPMGTGGAVAKAARGLKETFLVLNGDILTDIDLSAMVRFHRAKGGLGTISLGAVDDASQFGLVTIDERRRVLDFREKPPSLGPGLVNSGTYVLEPEALQGVPEGRPVSIERETFPGLISGGAALYAFVSEAYWRDLGTLDKYLRATFDVLDGRVSGLGYAAPYLDPAARVSLRARLGRWVVVGPGATVDADAEVEDSVILEDAQVGRGARVRDSLVGPGAEVEKGGIVEDAILAGGARSTTQMDAKRSGASPS